MASLGARDRLLLRGGVLGPVLFVAVFLVEGALRPAYDPIRFHVSELILTDRGWIQIANFVVSGLLVLGFAVGSRANDAAGAISVGAAIGIGMAGLGLVIAGVFPGDPTPSYPPGTLADGSNEGSTALLHWPA